MWLTWCVKSMPLEGSSYRIFLLHLCKSGLRAAGHHQDDCWAHNKQNILVPIL